MSIAQKFVVGLVAIGMITTLVLPDHQTVPVINAGKKLVTGSLHTAETGQDSWLARML
jgi:hypothetical protein